MQCNWVRVVTACCIYMYMYTHIFFCKYVYMNIVLTKMSCYFRLQFPAVSHAKGGACAPFPQKKQPLTGIF